MHARYHLDFNNKDGKLCSSGSIRYQCSVRGMKNKLITKPRAHSIPSTAKLDFINLGYSY
jgi:hypothetical protein